MQEELNPKNLKQEDLQDKIYTQLDFIRFISRLSDFAIKNDLFKQEDEALPYFRLIFNDLEEKCGLISEWTEQLCRINTEK